MAIIDTITTSWSSPEVLAEDEIWQARFGEVYVTTTAVPDPEDDPDRVAT